MQAVSMIAMIAITAMMLISGCEKRELSADADNGPGTDGGSAAAQAPEAGIADAAQESDDEGNEGIMTGIVGNVVMHPKCSSASISLLDMNDAKELCLNEDTLNIGIINDGETALMGVDIHIRGDKTEDIVTRVREGITMGGISRYAAIYDEGRYGRIEQVRIVPVIKINSGEEAQCPEKSIIDNSIDECQGAS